MSYKTLLLTIICIIVLSGCVDDCEASSGQVIVQFYPKYNYENVTNTLEQLSIEHNFTIDKWNRYHHPDDREAWEALIVVAEGWEDWYADELGKHETVYNAEPELVYC